MLVSQWNNKYKGSNHRFLNMFKLAFYNQILPSTLYVVVDISHQWSVQVSEKMRMHNDHVMYALITFVLL